ncbi:MAG TPA: CoA-binding protein [Candidatus Eisenbacteria bacterium]|nr:CoA-binding protein [Candidatus Eisenbacteria bacterium]
MTPNLLESIEAVEAAVLALRVVAVLGMKDGRDPSAPAYRIPQMLKERGVRVIPVNPKFESIDGDRCYATIADVPEPFDTLDVFRAPKFIAGIADEVLALPPERRPKLVWLQSGIRDDAAAGRLAAAGVQVVQDRCLGVDAAKFRPRA